MIMKNECKCGFDHWPLPCINEGQVVQRSVEIEREQLQTKQAKKVMPLIGSLLDAWDQLPGDLQGDDELSSVRDCVNAISAAMEDAE